MNKICFILDWEQNKKVSKKFLVAWPLPPPPLRGRATNKIIFFAAYLSNIGVNNPLQYCSPRRRQSFVFFLSFRRLYGSLNDQLSKSAVTICKHSRLGGTTRNNVLFSVLTVKPGKYSNFSWTQVLGGWVASRTPNQGSTGSGLRNLKKRFTTLP